MKKIERKKGSSFAHLGVSHNFTLSVQFDRSQPSSESDILALNSMPWVRRLSKHDLTEIWHNNFTILNAELKTFGPVSFSFNVAVGCVATKYNVNSQGDIFVVGDTVGKLAYTGGVAIGEYRGGGDNFLVKIDAETGTVVYAKQVSES